MKKNKKENIIVNVENVKTRSGWNGVKPYTRIHTPKVVYTRKGRRNGKEALVRAKLIGVRELKNWQIPKKLYRILYSSRRKRTAATQKPQQRI
jgi:UDP-glucose 4-epimerase